MYIEYIFVLRLYLHILEIKIVSSNFALEFTDFSDFFPPNAVHQQLQRCTDLK